MFVIPAESLRKRWSWEYDWSVVIVMTGGIAMALIPLVVGLLCAFVAYGPLAAGAVA